MMSGYFPVLSSWFLLKIFTSPPSRKWIFDSVCVGGEGGGKSRGESQS